MKIDLDWIQKELDAGREVELECVDKQGFIYMHRLNSSILNMGVISVTAYQGGDNYLEKGVHIKNHNEDELDDENCFINIEGLKYFRIKRSTQTFNDLIDVAVQAKKDGIISEINWGNDQSLSVFCADGLVVSANEEVTGAFIRNAINDIHSLYSETFVIDSECDISRVKTGADIELANGNKCTFLNNDGMWRIKDDKGFSHNCGLLVLKGATVTQKRS